MNHRARFKGWNFDPRWQSVAPRWIEAEQRYIEPVDFNKIAEPGQRPIVAFVGGLDETVAVQFVENNEEIVG